MRYVAITAFFATLLAGAPGEDCRRLTTSGKRSEARPCFEKLTRTASQWARAEGFWGLGQYSDANDAFKLAVGAEPKNAELRTRWGRLFLERFQLRIAGDLFKEALQFQPEYAPALLGTALVASEGFDQLAVEYAKKALTADPKLVEAQELLAKLALEDSNPGLAREEADKALKMSAEATGAMAVLASIDVLADTPTSPWFDKIKAVNPRSGQGYETAAHFLVLNRRYEEGIAMYRKALELDPDLQSARSQLGINLMRLGDDKEAFEQLETAYKAKYDSDATVN